MYRSCSQQFAHWRLNSTKLMDLLNDHLDDFETKVEFNRLDQTDMQVPRLIIAKFKRLLQLWRDNETLSKFLKSDKFEDIRSLVIDVLNEYDFRQNIRTTDSPDLSRDSESEPDYSSMLNLNSIVEHSYALQIASYGNFASMLMDNSRNEIKEHGIELIRRVNNDTGIYFRCFLCRVSIPIDEGKQMTSLEEVINSHEKEDEHRFNLLVFLSHQRYVSVHNSKEDSFQCTLCGEIFHLHLLMEHFANSQHTRRKLISGCDLNMQNINTNPPQIEFVVQVINEKGIFTKCHLCRTSIPIATSIQASKCVQSYLNDISDAHKSNEIHQFNSLVFYTHQPYIKTYNVEENSYICTLCNEILYVNSLMTHFTNPNHTKLKLLATCDTDIENFNELQISFIVQTAEDEGNLTKCHLCQIVICSGPPGGNLIEAHQRSVDHRFNFLVYKSHERYFRVINENRNFFQCELCGQVFFLGSLMSHFTDFKHTKLKLLSNCGM